MSSTPRYFVGICVIINKMRHYRIRAKLYFAGARRCRRYLRASVDRFPQHWKPLCTLQLRGVKSASGGVKQKGCSVSGWLHKAQSGLFAVSDCESAAPIWLIGIARIVLAIRPLD